MKVLAIVIFTLYSLGCAAAESQTQDSKPKTEKSNPAFVAPAKSKAPTELENIKEVFKKYSIATGVKSKIRKEVYLELLGEEKKSEGQIYFYKGNVRIDISKPEESMILLSPEVIWVVTPPDEDLGTKRQVTKILSKKLQSQSRAPLALLLTNDKSWDQFKVVEAKKDNGGNVISQLVPVDKSALQDIKRIEVHYIAGKKQVESISYWDDLENKTKFVFLQTDFNADVDPKLFKYTPPKDSEITIFE